MFPYYIHVWSNLVSMLHPRGRLERPCFHITSMFPYYIHVSILHPCSRPEWPCFRITSMFPCYIHVADRSGRVSMLHPRGRPEWPCFPFLSREGQCVGNKSPIHQAQRYSMCWDLTVCRVRLGLGDASLMNQSPNASWTDTYPKFDVGRLTFPHFRAKGLEEKDQLPE